MRKLLLLVFILACSSFVQAEEICISSFQEYSDKKSKLPKLFRQLPLLLGGEDIGMVFDVFAVLKIQVRDGVLVVQMDSWKATERYTELLEIKRACFETDTRAVKLEFSNKTSMTGSYTDLTVSVPHDIGTLVLNEITPAQERDIVRKIEEKVNKKRGRVNK